MANSLFENTYNPDVLTCLANLSNDEVFTPPTVVNDMLDMLPQELFRDPKTKFLDPVCKSGVFLREIAKRLIKGLEKEIPDLQERLDHIFKEQLFGIAITELTSYLARRSLYCSKWASGKYSIVKFKNIQGNVRYKALEHRFQGGKCVYCGASEKTLGPKTRLAGAESHAYEFIHTVKPEEIWNMKFDVIIGNPPYQLNDGGGTGTSATPLYDKFIEQAKKLSPRYLSMIIPARWYSGGKGLDDFRDRMFKDKRLRKLVDYFDSADCFPGVDISGGVCYFLWERDNPGDCEIEGHLNNETKKATRPLLDDSFPSFVRFNEAIPILKKVFATKQKPFMDIVSTRKPFGLSSQITGIKESPFPESVKIYAYPKTGYIPLLSVPENRDSINAYKVFIAKAYGERGKFPYLVTSRPFLGERGTCCSETYLQIGCFSTEAEAKNVISYINTRFFRFLVLLKKNTQNAPKSVYEFVPMQDFTEPWTDEKLYKKYGLSEEDTTFIERMVRMPGEEYK